MKRFHGLIIVFAFLFACVGGVWLMVKAAAEYPNRGEAVSYSVNQVDGVELTIEKPFQGQLAAVKEEMKPIEEIRGRVEKSSHAGAVQT